MIVCSAPGCQTTAGCQCGNLWAPSVTIPDYAAALAEISRLRAELAAANERAVKAERRSCDNGFCNTDHWYDSAKGADAVIATLTAERDGLRRALARAAGPLEAMLIAGTYKAHSHEMQVGIEEGAAAIREALALRSDQEVAALSVSPAGEG